MTVELFYYAISPPARACELLLMLNKVDFKLTEVDLFKGEQNKPEFLAINPAHCIPTLKDGDFAVWESRAIMQYVMNKFAPESSMYPKDAQARAKVDYLMYWDMGELYGSIMTWVYPQLGFRSMPADLEAEEKKFHSKLAFLEEHLLKADYLTGDNITIADISIAISLTMPTILDVSYEKYEKLSAWLGRIHALPEWKTVDDKFQPGRKMLQEKMKQA